ncbi:uncharacterized protein LTHEOB_9664 [Lasiodiplodia theobromae]|uniref:Bactericidal permeability-increasing protein n=1 Tax=Lasiodiplodia theobromae TaxID=45133 RepID=A0A5N5DUE6_9PEZI|nr:uncharacterized protein LTHEOB_9664 [Lasiodiplodia theobromae]KAB2581323.1 Uncharacterized protein DBV05_g199 [Lasiodiplodia theobromae]KAF4539852.1 hypothetical protein LTHEOB_9664 [Lasiodiplodia theobromae]
MASKAVNRPTDTQVKERDVNNKLQLYGIYSAFTNGKVPSNKQIDVALNSALASKPLASPSKKLSADGQKLVGDLRDVIEAAKLLVLTKNDGNLLQDFIWQTQQIHGGDAKAPNAPIDKDTARQHGNEALEGLRTLGTLIISNGQFRKLLKDAQIILRDMVGDAATKTANRVNPTEEQLAQLDDPAADNTWHETPDFKGMKAEYQEKYNKNKLFGKKQAQKTLDNSAQVAQAEGAEAGANAGLVDAKQRLDENIPEEKQDQARQYRERTQNYLREKMPKERREQTIWRLKKMVVEVQGHQDYMRAIETLLRLAEEYTGHSRNLAGQGSGAVKGAHKDDALQGAETDLKTLLERFANSTSLDDLFDSINQIYKDADRDPDLKNWFKNLDTYIRRCLKEQGFIMQPVANEEWNRLYDQGRFLLRERYRTHTDRIIDEFKFIGQQFDADPQNKAFGNALNKLFLDLGQDETGAASFKPHLLKDLSEVIVPAFFENVRYVPIPRIEYTDPEMDAIVENLVIEGDNLAPNVLEFASDNHWRWGRKKITNKNKNKVMISVSGVQMDLRDVSYYVNRKKGFPSLKDKGVADIFLGGEGLSFKISAETADKADGQHFFKVSKVDVDVKNFSIKLKKSNHKLLFGLVKPLLIKVIRPVLQKVLEKQIKDSFIKADALLYDIHEEAERAKAELKKNPDPENAQNLYQRYAAATQKKLMEMNQKKEKAKEAVADKKVNVAVTQHDSIFKDITLTGGISSKATEFKDLAKQGDKWESPVFSIGSAKETSNLPKISAVTRKPHRTTVDNAGYANGNPNFQTQHFQKEVNQAFNGTTEGADGLRTGINGQHTTLGSANPVIQGSV